MEEALQTIPSRNRPRFKAKGPQFPKFTKVNAKGFSGGTALHDGDEVERWRFLKGHGEHGHQQRQVNSPNCGAIQGIRKASKAFARQIQGIREGQEGNEEEDDTSGSC